MIKRFIRMLKFIDIYGWTGFLTFFIPVYWKQDIDMKNNGHDVWSFKKIKGEYFKGTITERDDAFNIKPFLSH